MRGKMVLMLMVIAVGKEVNETKEELAYGLFTSHCWDELVVKVSFDFDCVKHVLSKFLGYCIVIVSSVVKIPQIVNIVSARSTKGLAELVLYTEAFGYMAGTFYPLHYSQPFSTYGENFFIWLQAMLILCLLWYYKKPATRLLELLGLLWATSAVVLYCFMGRRLMILCGRVFTARARSLVRIW
eukprot:TRINITY_DN13428_c0_g1_i1.p1 TRINITY_DN13428_c0_g1~~TRINITY_DN13428_c0_g1_i1.p1  ORF type:complete len:184 (-),score=10.08 TRINITY_DN13428_c0_g1_i1:435-986(-)